MNFYAGEFLHKSQAKFVNIALTTCRSNVSLWRVFPSVSQKILNVVIFQAFAQVEIPLSGH